MTFNYSIGEKAKNYWVEHIEIHRENGLIYAALNVAVNRLGSIETMDFFMGWTKE